MRKSDNTKNSTISSNFFTLLAIVLSILMIGTSSSLMPSSLFSLAFASHGTGYHYSDLILPNIARGSNNNNQAAQEDDDLGLIGNLISGQQQSLHAVTDARNVNVDNDVIIEGCEDGKVVINDNDEIIQTNALFFNQEDNNQVREEEEAEDREPEQDQQEALVSLQALSAVASVTDLEGLLVDLVQVTDTEGLADVVGASDSSELTEMPRVTASGLANLVEVTNLQELLELVGVSDLEELVDLLDPQASPTDPPTEGEQEED